MMEGEYYQCHLKLSISRKNYMKNNGTGGASHHFEAEMESQTAYIRICDR
jgi:hypothetical protein